MINEIGIYLHRFVIIHYPFLMVTAIGKAMIMLTIVANLQLRQKKQAHSCKSATSAVGKVNKVDKQKA